LADNEVGLNAERLDDLVKRLKCEKGRAEALPMREDKFIWVLDASSGDVLRIEVPSHFPENGDYENYLEANLPEGYRLKDCDWMVGGFHFREVVRERYYLGF
jgi:hypothetical protein